jgi:hypothetical protein
MMPYGKGVKNKENELEDIYAHSILEINISK